MTFTLTFAQFFGALLLAGTVLILAIVLGISIGEKSRKRKRRRHDL